MSDEDFIKLQSLLDIMGLDMEIATRIFVKKILWEERLPFRLEGDTCGAEPVDYTENQDPLRLIIDDGTLL